MAEDIQSFSVTVPAGTPIATPQTTAFKLSVRIVRRIEVRIPPGPLGNVGFAITEAGTVSIPGNGANWIIADNESLGWDVNGYIESGSWGLLAYNTGTFNHTLYVRFLMDLPRAPVESSRTPIPSGVLSNP